MEGVTYFEMVKRWNVFWKLLPFTHIGWYEQDGCEASFKSMSERGSGGADGIPGSGSNIKTIGEVKSLQVGLNSDKGEYYSTVATSVMFQKDKALYQSCIQSGSDGKGCNKKVCKKEI